MVKREELLVINLPDFDVGLALAELISSLGFCFSWAGWFVTSAVFEAPPTKVEEAMLFCICKDWMTKLT